MSNRRSQPPGGMFVAAIKVLMGCGMIGAIGVGYLWQQKQIHMLAETYKQCGQDLQRLQRENRLHRSELDHLRLVPVIENRVKEMNLGLVPAQPEQIVRLVEVSSTPPGTPIPPRTSRTVLVSNSP
jgi:hypothetical protein